MHLTNEQLDRYRTDGYLFLPGLLSESEVDLLVGSAELEMADDTPRRVLEKDGVTVRSIYGSHAANPVFKSLVRDVRTLTPAQQILGSDVYVHQFKINSKLAFRGDIWEWHQDYIFWLREDGIPSPQLATAAIFLHDVNEFNGPLVLIAGSHHSGLIDVTAKGDKPSSYEDWPDWISNLTADIKYSVPQPVVAGLIRSRSLVAPKGPRGSVLFFHPNMVHGSASNISPFDRTVVLITYNSTANCPDSTGPRRPEFLCSRDFTALAPISDQHRSGAALAPLVSGMAVK